MRRGRGSHQWIRGGSSNTGVCTVEGSVTKGFQVGRWCEEGESEGGSEFSGEVVRDEGGSDSPY